MESRTLFAPMGDWSIAYESNGAGGPTVVLIHGASSDRTIWREVRDELGTAANVIMVDRLGYGESDKPDINYSMSVFADSIVAVLKHEHAAPAFLVGHSNGVAVSREVYRQYPEVVAGLLWLDGPVTPALSPQQLEWMTARLDSPDYTDTMQQMVDQMPAGNMTDDQLHRVKRGVLGVARHVMKGELRAITEPTIWKQDPVDVPLRVIRAASPQLDATEPSVIAKLQPHARYEVWDGVSHFLILEDARRVARCIAELSGLDLDVRMSSP